MSRGTKWLGLVLGVSLVVGPGCESESSGPPATIPAGDEAAESGDESSGDENSNTEVDATDNDVAETEGGEEGGALVRARVERVAPVLRDATATQPDN
mgnify:CR=1 FL=1